MHTFTQNRFCSFSQKNHQGLKISSISYGDTTRFTHETGNTQKDGQIRNSLQNLNYAFLIKRTGYSTKEQKPGLLTKPNSLKSHYFKILLRTVQNRIQIAA